MTKHNAALFLTVFLLSLTLATNLYANVPLSLEIVGPRKICTNDQVTYSAVLHGGGNGAQIQSCKWTVNGTIVQSLTCGLTAPSSDCTILVSCEATVIDGGSSRIMFEGIIVAVVTPNIVISRKSYIDSDLSDIEEPGTYTITSQNGVALIHRNIMGIWEEALEFDISITPGDIDVVQFSVDSCDTSKIGMCMGQNDSYGHHYNPGGGMKKISEILSDLSPNKLRAWGISCGTGATLSLKINNNQKATWSYDIYGIEGNSVFAGIEYEASHSHNFPNLVRNEWGLILPQGNYYYYNGVAYAIKKPPTYNGFYFWVDKIDQSGHNLNATDLAHAFYGLPNGTYPTRYKTSMDTFGDNNGSFSLSDADDFFESNLWGVNKMTSTTVLWSETKIVYYDNHAARKSTLTGGCYTGWHLFESKDGSGYIIIHRAEQLLGGKYNSIQKQYK